MPPKKPNNTKETKEREISIKWKTQKSTDENSSILQNLKGSAYSAYQTYFEKGKAQTSSLIKEFVQIINYWCVLREKGKKLVNFQGESLVNLIQFLKTDPLYQKIKPDVEKFTLNLLATKDLAAKNHRLKVDSIQQPKLNDFVNILEKDDTDVNYYVIPAIGKVVNENPFQVLIQHHNHIHYEKMFPKKNPLSVLLDMTSVIEAYEETEQNFSTMLPSNRISANVSSLKNKPKAKKPSHNSSTEGDETSDYSSEPTNKTSSKKNKSSNKSKAAALKRKKQFNEDEFSTDTDESDFESSKKKRNSSKQVTPPEKKKKAVPTHDLDSDESTTEDSEDDHDNSTPSSTYFEIRHVKGKQEVVIVPDQVDYIFGLLDKDKAFPEFINAIIKCEKVLTALTEKFAPLFSALQFNTSVNGTNYTIPSNVVKMVIGTSVTQKQCLQILAKHHFDKPLTALTTDEKTVCRRFFETKGWQGESVRKVINNLGKEMHSSE